MTDRRDPPQIVAMLTDFGHSDPYLGIVQGVMLREAPELRMVDLSHQVPPGDLTIGGFWLAQAHSWFPPGTVHLCVVDPGVGGSRALIAARGGDQIFVAPDNGILSEALAMSPSPSVHRILPERLGLRLSSRTFHARDVFGPVAARLAIGRLTVADVGPLHAPVERKRAVPERGPEGVQGRVLFADHFGNLVSDIPSGLVDFAHDQVRVARRALRVVGTYVEADPGECVALPSSFGTLEVAQRDGSAFASLGVERGASILLEARR